MSTARTLLTLAMCCAFSSILRAAAGGTPVPIAPPAITVTPGHDLAAAGWREKVYRTGNLWEALYKDGLPALRCTSNRSASMLYRTVHYNARDFPLLRWQWRVERLPLRSGELTRANDDYAARIYVFFPGWTFLGSRVLEYVWDTDAAAGTIRTSPTSNRCKHLVVASGNSSPGTWVTVERNLREDYARAFGSPPDRPVGAIGFMTDADNTRSAAVAYYGPLEILK